MRTWTLDTHEKADHKRRDQDTEPAAGVNLTFIQSSYLFLDDNAKSTSLQHLSDRLFPETCECCVYRNVLRGLSPCGPPAACRGSAEPQTGPRLWAWPRGSAACPGSSRDPLHPGPRWSVRWQQYLQIHKQTYGERPIKTLRVYDRSVTREDEDREGRDVCNISQDVASSDN